jgi:hypothetical protein
MLSATYDVVWDERENRKRKNNGDSRCKCHVISGTAPARDSTRAQGKAFTCLAIGDRPRWAGPPQLATVFQEQRVR